MNLVVDIGNTHTKLAWFEQGKLIESIRADKGTTQGLDKKVTDKPVQHAIISSVGPMDNDLMAALEKVTCNTLVLSQSTPLPFRNLYGTPSSLGHDRVAAAAGARSVFPDRDALIMDLGTAITIDFITAAGEYLGGNISPGMHTRFRALHEFTANLPLIVRDPDYPEFGKDTRTAIVAGVQQGIIYELNSYVDEFARVHPNCVFIITGGDAGFFVSKIKRYIFALPDLVLNGLNYILEFNTGGLQ